MSMRSAASCCQPRHESSRPRGARTGRGPDVIGEDTNSGPAPGLAGVSSSIDGRDDPCRARDRRPWRHAVRARRERACAHRARARDGRAARRLGRGRVRPDDRLRQPRERAHRSRRTRARCSATWSARTRSAPASRSRTTPCAACSSCSPSRCGAATRASGSSSSSCCDRCSSATSCPSSRRKGSVGSSGDLAPLAHLALVLIGEGEAFFEGHRMPGADALRRASLEPVELAEKEGLALINGTHLMAAAGGLAIVEARRVLEVAIVASALSLEAFMGSTAPFDDRIHALRPQRGQRRVATRLRELLARQRDRREPRRLRPRAGSLHPALHPPGARRDLGRARLRRRRRSSSS